MSVCLPQAGALLLLQWPCLLAFCGEAGVGVGFQSCSQEGVEWGVGSGRGGLWPPSWIRKLKTPRRPCQAAPEAAQGVGRREKRENEVGKETEERTKKQDKGHNWSTPQQPCCYKTLISPKANGFDSEGWGLWSYRNGPGAVGCHFR